MPPNIPIGTAVSKEFYNAHGVLKTFAGKVAGYKRFRVGNRYPLWYLIEYEDGDSEHLSENAVKQIMVKEIPAEQDEMSCAENNSDEEKGFEETEKAKESLEETVNNRSQKKSQLPCAASSPTTSSKSKKPNIPLGTPVLKEFYDEQDELKPFSGKVIGYKRIRVGSRFQLRYLVEYEDGDSEHLSENAVKKIRVKESPTEQDETALRENNTEGKATGEENKEIENSKTQKKSQLPCAASSPTTTSKSKKPIIPLGTPVLKEFYDEQDELKPFSGKVIGYKRIRVGSRFPLRYLVEYEDGDSEHLSENAVKKIRVKESPTEQDETALRENNTEEEATGKENKETENSKTQKKSQLPCAASYPTTSIKSKKPSIPIGTPVLKEFYNEQELKPLSGIITGYKRFRIGGRNPLRYLIEYQDGVVERLSEKAVKKIMLKKSPTEQDETAPRETSSEEEAMETELEETEKSKAPVKSKKRYIPIGTPVSKDFCNKHGVLETFAGKVAGYKRFRVGNRYPLRYLVEYEDGDSEHLSENAVKKIMLKKSPTEQDETAPRETSSEEEAMETELEETEKSKAPVKSKKRYIPIGTPVSKEFCDAHGVLKTFAGKVAGYKRFRVGNRYPLWYLIEYEDGDSEHLSENAVKKIMLKKSPTEQDQMSCEENNTNKTTHTLFEQNEHSRLSTLQDPTHSLMGYISIPIKHCKYPNGTRISRMFLDNQLGVERAYGGQVLEYAFLFDEECGKSDWFYRIQYDDGDWEYMSEEEVALYLVKGDDCVFMC